MRKIAFLALGALVMTSTIASSAEVASQKPKTPNGKQLVCKIDLVTGSLTRSRRICMTRDEWDKLAQGTGQSVTDYIRESQRPDRIAKDPQVAW